MLLRWVLMGCDNWYLRRIDLINISHFTIALIDTSYCVWGYRIAQIHYISWINEEIIYVIWRDTEPRITLQLIHQCSYSRRQIYRNPPKNWHRRNLRNNWIWKRNLPAATIPVPLRHKLPSNWLFRWMWTPTRSCIPIWRDSVSMTRRSWLPSRESWRPWGSELASTKSRGRLRYVVALRYNDILRVYVDDGSLEFEGRVWALRCRCCCHSSAVWCRLSYW